MNKQTAEGRPLLRWLALVLSLAGLVILVVLLIPRKERATMLPAATPTEMTAETTPETMAEQQTDTPPIDANAPTQTKTATFALG